MSISNYLRWSEDFKHWVNGWSENSEQGIDFNFGANTKGTYLTETATYAPHYLLSEFMELPLGWYTFSIYAKGVDREKIRLKSSDSNIFDLDATWTCDGRLGIWDDRYEELLKDDWYRIAVTGEVLSNDMFRVQIMVISDDDEWEFFGTKNEGLYIYGAQLEDAASQAANEEPGEYVHTIGYIK